MKTLLQNEFFLSGILCNLGGKKISFIFKVIVVCIRVSPTGFLESDLDAKLKIDVFQYELWNSVKKSNVH